jgi:hypothetical protein
MLLIILIPLAWLAVLTLFVAICRMAALGDDAAPGPVEERSSHRVGDGLVIWEDPSEVALKDQRGRKSHSGQRLATHGIR